MLYLFAIVYIVSTGIHLFASLKKNALVRGITKPFILLSLVGIYCVLTTDFRWSVVVALLFSWLGDVLLIPKGIKWFTAGGIAFMVSHAFFIVSYIPDIDFAKIPIVAIVGFAILFIIVVTFIFTKLKKHLPKAIFYPMYFYLLLNGAMNCFAIYRLLSVQTPFTITTCVGAVLFFISDSSLFFVRFNKDCRMKTHFIVMLTYSIGELLIVLGLA